MPGLTKMAVPKGLGLVAVLAASGTALYLVYEFKKKKTFESIRRGSGTLRMEYRVRPHGPPEQQDTTESQELGGCSRGRLDGDEGEIRCQHLPCLRRASRRHSEQPLKLLAAASGPSEISHQDEESVVDGQIERNADEGQIRLSASKTRLLNSAAADQHQEGCGERLHNSSRTVGFVEKNSDTESLDALYKMDRGSSDSLSSTDDSDEFSARPAVDNLVLQSSSSSSDEECSSKTVSLAAVSSLPAPSNAAAPPPPRSFAIVGCFVHSGSGSAAGKRKKVVRFSPSVTEPSSNNQDYRRRFKTQMAQKAARNGHQKSYTPSSGATKSVAYDRPTLYSQAAKQAITYSVQRADYRCGGRSY